MADELSDILRNRPALSIVGEYLIYLTPSMLYTIAPLAVLIAVLVSGLTLKGVADWVTPLCNGVALIVGVGLSARARKRNLRRLHIGRGRHALRSLEPRCGANEIPVIDGAVRLRQQTHRQRLFRVLRGKMGLSPSPRRFSDSV